MSTSDVYATAFGARQKVGTAELNAEGNHTVTLLPQFKTTELSNVEIGPAAENENFVGESRPVTADDNISGETDAVQDETPAAPVVEQRPSTRADRLADK